MEDVDGEEENVFEDNTGREEGDLSDMQVYLHCLYFTSTRVRRRIDLTYTPSLISLIIVFRLKAMSQQK